MTRALGQVPAAAKDHISGNLFAHFDQDDGPRLTQAEADAAAQAVVIALRSDGWHITAPHRTTT